MNTTRLLILTSWFVATASVHAQVTYFFGDNTPGASQNIVQAFNAWKGGVGPSVATMTGAALAAGTIAGAGGTYVIDTGINASSPFGASPTSTEINDPPPWTRTYGGGVFTYTVYNTPMLNTNPATWNTPAAYLGNQIYYPGSPSTLSAQLLASHNA
ncbi:MAG: hypothetical protein NZM04_07510, partial [Methylacidiphilales bacterium]|nr:hypothetical protein [Candidatus Methylacidiphilales bacterium]